MSFLKFLFEQEDDGLPRGDEPGMVPDPDEQLVLVKGIGKMKLGQVRQKVKNMLSDIAQEPDWKRVKWKLQHSALHAYLDTLIAQEKN